MNADKLKDIINRKNEQLEADAVRTAEELINDIVELTECIANAEKAIAAKREELKKLEIQTVNADAVLGKE